MAATAAAAVLQQPWVWKYATPAEIAARHAAFIAPTAVKFTARSIGSAGRPAAKRERKLQCAVLRDIFGNPFCTTVVDPGSLAWNDGTVGALAQAIYEEGAFDRMPILADALEDAGSDNADILDHCRQPGEHVLGCWVVDLVLGKS